MNETFRVYTSSDVIGVEIGAALKNVIALAAGIADGLGCGDNTKAALITRGIAEIGRLGIKMGGKPETFAGLSGIGDLVVTCTSMHSRNRRFGILLGQGMPIEDALKKIGMVVEGYTTQEAAFELAQKYNVEMPITFTMHRLFNGEIEAEECISILMGRKEKNE
jgi:glycerol-3-phosphate dehydrogenase (NAD(P)+)